MNTADCPCVLNVRTCDGAVTVTHGAKQRCYWEIFSGLLVADVPSHPLHTILPARGYSSRDYARKYVILYKHYTQLDV